MFTSSSSFNLQGNEPGVGHNLKIALNEAHCNVHQSIALRQISDAAERIEAYETILKPLSELSNSSNDRSSLKSALMELYIDDLKDVIAALDSDLQKAPKAWQIVLDVLKLRVTHAVVEKAHPGDLFELETAVDMASKVAEGHPVWTKAIEEIYGILRPRLDQYFRNISRNNPKI